MRNIYTRYHICQMRTKSRRVSLERWFDVKYLSCRYHRSSCCLPHTTCIPGTCHSPNYHYIVVTVVYLVYCITAVCVSWFCDHRAYISDEYIVSTDAGCARNRRKLIFWRQFDAKYLHQVSCLMRVKSRRVSLKRRFDVKYSWCKQTLCLLGV